VAARNKRVGVLAIQGAVDKHLAILEGLGVEATRVLGEADLVGLDGLIIPGGESTTISKGLSRLGLWEPIRAYARSGGAILGTCAGAILLARACENHPVATLELLDLKAIRNAYGTQVDSFVAPCDSGGEPKLAGMQCVFIRAPQVGELGPDVEVLLRVDGLPVLVRQGRLLAATFHPELAGDPRVHALLLAD
jgi:pyridoxal 5'-phosphate synthase pdxT subunit